MKTTKHVPQQSWDVIEGKIVIDTVFYDKTCSASYVKDSLIYKEDYSPSIRVAKTNS